MPPRFSAQHLREDTPDSEEESKLGAAGKKRKRIHVSRACGRCRKRKIKCNGAQPCEVCIDRGYECEYEEMGDRRRTNDELQLLKERLEIVERILDRHGLTESRSISDDSASSQGLSNPGDYNDGEELSGPARPHHVGRPPVEVWMRPRVARAKDLWTGAEEEVQRLRPKHPTLLQYGETSIWNHDPSNDHSRPPTPQPVSGPSNFLPPIIQPEVDWSRSLPPINLPKHVHERALEHWSAYIAPWCLVVDMPAFLRDMATCNSSAGGPSRTADYSPLLHCAVLFLGMYYGRDEWPGEMERYGEVFLEHCTRLITKEFAKPTLSSLRAVNVLGTCLAEPPHGSTNLGYTFFGWCVAMVQVLGLNVDCDGYVAQGRMSAHERDLRINAYWSAYTYDVLRAIAAGRPPMIAASEPVISLPSVNKRMDDEPWLCPTARSDVGSSRLGGTLHGCRSLRSTVFYWTARLMIILKRVFDALYTHRKPSSAEAESIQILSGQLDQWHHHLPTAIRRPEDMPLPHVIILHLTAHLTRIFLLRPFYKTPVKHSRESGPTASERCNEAASRSLRLLGLYEQYHGVRRAPGTFINVMFSTATILLLRAVDAQGSSDFEESRQDIRDILNHMRELARTFWEAGRGVSILLSLCAEWLPGVVIPPSIPSSPPVPPPDLDTASQFPTNSQHAPDPFLNLDMLSGEVGYGGDLGIVGGVSGEWAMDHDWLGQIFGQAPVAG